MDIYYVYIEPEKTKAQTRYKAEYNYILYIGNAFCQIVYSFFLVEIEISIKI